MKEFIKFRIILSTFEYFYKEFFAFYLIQGKGNRFLTNYLRSLSNFYLVWGIESADGIEL